MAGKMSMANIETTEFTADGPSATASEPLSGRTVSLPWHRVLLAAILAFSAWLNFDQLSRYGYSNSFYASAVRSMMQSWHNFFFASFDPGGFVTIDKPPVGFWFQVLSAKIFGYNGVSLLLPSALAGVLSVWLLYYLVNRRFGHGAGLLAALALAVTPVAVASNRSNIIDSILVLFLLLGAWAAITAVERGSLRWLLLCAVFVGIGFNIKMLEAFLVVPAFGVTYLLGAHRSWWTRIWHLLLATIVLLAVSLSWAVAVDLTPASQRPWVDSTTTNSELDLAIGYNGLDRLLGMHGPGGRGGGNRGPGFDFSRLDRTGNLLPGINSDMRLSAIGGGATRTQPRLGGQFAPLGTDARRFGDGFSRNFDGMRRAGGTGGGAPGGGMFDNSAAGPFRLLSQSLGGQAGWLLPLAVLGFLAAASRRRVRLPLDEQQHDVVLWGVWLITAGAFFSVAGFFHSYYLVTLAPAAAALAGIGGVTLWRDYIRRGWRGWLLPVVLLATAAVQVSLLRPYPNWSSWLDPLILSATIAASIVLVAGRMRRPARLRRTLRLWTPLAVVVGLLALLAAPAAWSVYTTTQGGGGMTPAAGPSAGGFGGGFGGGRGGFGGDLGSANSGLVTYLEQHQGTTKYLVAVQNSNSAAPYVIETGKPVMSLGGFGGSDPILTLSDLQQLVKDNVVRYFLGVGGFGGGNSGIGQWVQSACTAVPSSDYSGSASQAAAVAGSNPGSGPAGPGNAAQPGQSPSTGPGGFGGGAGGFGGRGGGFGGFGSGSQLYDCAHAVP
jgi:4-amino-4-deoxy-L-arabinose transferase-like glycosyltransferase